MQTAVCGMDDLEKDHALADPGFGKFVVVWK